MNGKEVAKIINEILQDIKPEDFPKDAVNWADLSVIEVSETRIIFPIPDGRAVYHIVISEASPDTWAFREHICGEFFKQTEHHCTISTEW